MYDPPTEPAELLFSYGTLQLEPVQLVTFGRTLEGTEDQLVGYKSGWLQIADSAVIEASGRTRHPIIAFTGRPTDLVRGTLFRVTRAELQHADTYEVSDYRREYLTLASGRNAWVYVDARVSPMPRGRAGPLPRPEEKS